MELIMDQMKEDIERQKKLVADTAYMEWLYEYTEGCPEFNTLNLEYKKGCEHYDQLILLNDLFAAIDSYHRKNLLRAGQAGYEIWYNIKYKDAYFVIGVCVGQGAFNFVERVMEGLDGVDEYTDFSQIMAGKQDDNYAMKCEKLRELEAFMKELKELKMPAGEIQNVFDEVFK